MLLHYCGKLQLHSAVLSAFLLIMDTANLVYVYVLHVLAAGICDNYPEGVTDYTHLHEHLSQTPSLLLLLVLPQ